MVAKDKEVLSAATLVASHKAVGLPTLGLEERQDVLVAKLRRVPVVLAVEFVFVIALHVHLASHPVAAAFHALCSPMSPNTELGIAEPLRRLVLLQRLPSRFIPSRLHLLVLLADRYPVRFLRQSCCRGADNGK